MASRGRNIPQCVRLFSLLRDPWEMLPVGSFNPICSNNGIPKMHCFFLKAGNDMANLGTGLKASFYFPVFEVERMWTWFRDSSESG